MDATPTPSSTDEEAVRDLCQQLMDAWNQGSGAGVFRLNKSVSYS
jgi:hypothetical protein